MENDDRPKKDVRGSRHTKVIQAKIRRAREELGMTQREFATWLENLRPKNVPGRLIIQSRVAKWECGEGQPLGPDLVVLEKATKKSLRYWCDDTIDDPSEVAPAPPPRARTKDEEALDAVVGQLGVAEVLRRVMWYAAGTAPAPQAVRGHATIVEPPTPTPTPPGPDESAAEHPRRKR